MIRGINLYQFEKVDYFEFEEKTWYTITDEAKDCYAAYFDELGINNDEANEQIRAFELLQVLRKNTYLKFSEGQNDHGHSGPEDNEKEIERRISEVMGKEKFF
jgi:hypothetical protein